MIKERNVVTAILLSLVTCGLYGIYWFVSITDDMKTASGDETLPSGVTAFLLTLVTCGIYGFYWIYKMAKAEMMMKSKYGLPVKDNVILYVILQVLGLGIVNYCLMQSELNTVATMGTQTNSMQQPVQNVEQNNDSNQNTGV